MRERPWVREKASLNSLLGVKEVTVVKVGGGVENQVGLDDDLMFEVLGWKLMVESISEKC